ncbi:MAG: hypothetical protein EOO75_03245 [Myxococcales bacterium]|nr:MAG: hypothetical protein EOO75_03245 [Myxococcales bacterium]
MRTRLLALSLALAACTSESPSIRKELLGEACTTGTTCAAGSQCLSINGFEQAPEGAVCARVMNPCDVLDCDGLDCAVNETYPPQVHCE